MPGPDPDLVRGLLLLIAGAVSNPPSSEQFEMHAYASTLALDGIPDAVFDRHASTAALRTFKAWPSVAEVYAFLQERRALLALPIAA